MFKEKVSSFVKNDSGCSGILGEINWNWIHIQDLWIDKNIRKGGRGTKLLSRMEEYAVSQNTPSIRLETTTFQARDFTSKLVTQFLVNWLICLKIALVIFYKSSWAYNRALYFYRRVMRITLYSFYD